ncbi:glycerophosphodiester phosphodiesterase 1 [Holotrichia oblita]|uniref:Glycerophosphodiester phosphodiesterase 1 n=1 Tax=Holotrichia oblita TaxID=644536 RepID=A0ACB9SS10_HOLOL|nr:glycerophosphodiester phosphodiesterase 1 [Holotrichia oblita]
MPSLKIHYFRDRYKGTTIPTLDETVKQLLDSEQNMFIDIKDNNMQVLVLQSYSLSDESSSELSSVKLLSSSSSCSPSALSVNEHVIIQIILPEMYTLKDSATVTNNIPSIFSMLLVKQMVKVVLDLYEKYPALYLRAITTSFFPNLIYFVSYKVIRRRNPKIVCSLAWRPYAFSHVSYSYAAGKGPRRSTVFYKHIFNVICDKVHEFLLSTVTYHLMGISFILLHKDAICG